MLSNCQSGLGQTKPLDQDKKHFFIKTAMKNQETI